MMAEHNAETFSSEDAPNVVIPCSLSALLYDLLPNIKSLLSNNQRAIKMFEVCAEVCQVTPDFFITGNRLIEIIAPVISQTVKAV